MLAYTCCNVVVARSSVCWDICNWIDSLLISACMPCFSSSNCSIAFLHLFRLFCSKSFYNLIWFRSLSVCRPLSLCGSFWIFYNCLSSLTLVLSCAIFATFAVWSSICYLSFCTLSFYASQREMYLFIFSIRAELPRHSACRDFAIVLWVSRFFWAALFSSSYALSLFRAHNPGDRWRYCSCELCYEVPSEVPDGSEVC